MIGRFASLGAYRGLFSMRAFSLCLGGGGLALAAFLVGQADGPRGLAVALGLAAVAVNGLPIVLEAAQGASSGGASTWTSW